MAKDKAKKLSKKIIALIVCGAILGAIFLSCLALQKRRDNVCRG